MDDVPVPTPSASRLPDKPRDEREQPGRWAGDLTAASCAGLGVVALATATVSFGIELWGWSGAPGLGTTLWLLRKAPTVLLITGLLGALTTRSRFARRLFAFSSVLFLTPFVVRLPGLGLMPPRAAIGLVLVAGAAWWLRKRKHRDDDEAALLSESHTAALSGRSSAG